MNLRVISQADGFVLKCKLNFLKIILNIGVLILYARILTKMAVVNAYVKSIPLFTVMYSNAFPEQYLNDLQFQ